MRRFAPLLIPLLLTAASAPVPSVPLPLDAALRSARAEQSAAQREAARLEDLAVNARDEAGRLRARRDAAAQAIEAAEAGITASDMQLRLASGYVAAHRQRLAEEQRPAASLLAGLAVMAQRPPLLALADRGGTDELVKVRLLLDSTLPVIRARTARLSAQLAEGRRLEQSALAARAALVAGRKDLSACRASFAALEQQAVDHALAAGGQALGAGDVALAAGEDVERLRGAEAGSREAARLAATMAAADPAPARPAAAEGTRPAVPFAYRLPAVALVTEGLGSVNASGVQSRGLTLATPRGATVVAPAVGTVRFAGPFRGYDGVVIIDHGGGWMSLIVNIASPLKPGARINGGEPLGRALGPIDVELSQNGRRFSPALIAGSSGTLSKTGKGR
jgi:septal ring factor EnvC (AmiA/AmiB activator)